MPPENPGQFKSPWHASRIPGGYVARDANGRNALRSVKMALINLCCPDSARKTMKFARMAIFFAGLLFCQRESVAQVDQTDDYGHVDIGASAARADGDHPLCRSAVLPTGV